MLGFKLHYQIEPIGFADEYRVRGKENPVSGVWAVRFIVVPFAKVLESYPVGPALLQEFFVIRANI